VKRARGCFERGENVADAGRREDAGERGVNAGAGARASIGLGRSVCGRMKRGRARLDKDVVDAHAPCG
jgi:hypothetical protein